MKKVTKEQLEKLIVSMRFQHQQCRNLKYGCMSYAEISRIVGKSTYYCRKICLNYANMNKLIS